MRDVLETRNDNRYGDRMNTMDRVSRRYLGIQPAAELSNLNRYNVRHRRIYFGLNMSCVIESLSDPTMLIITSTPTITRELYMTETQFFSLRTSLNFRKMYFKRGKPVKRPLHEFKMTPHIQKHLTNILTYAQLKLVTNRYNAHSRFCCHIDTILGMNFLKSL